MTITEFLLARIAEDEYEAHVCLEQYARGEGDQLRAGVSNWPSVQPSGAS